MVLRDAFGLATCWFLSSWFECPDALLCSPSLRGSMAPTQQEGQLLLKGLEVIEYSKNISLVAGI